MLNKSRSQRIRELANQKLPPRQIRAITGESFCLIYQVRRRMGLTNVEPKRERVEIPQRERKGRHWTPEQISELRQLKQQGASYAALGKMYGVKRQRIQQLLKGSKESRCQVCGTTENLHAHHLDYIENSCETLCCVHHREKHLEKRP